MKLSFNLIILIAVTISIIKPAMADVVSGFDFIFLSRPTYLIMTIDKNGKPIFQRESEGHAPIMFINRPVRGLCKRNSFENALDYNGFQEGLIAVQLNNKWGYADKNCKIVIQPQFNQVFNFSDGLAGVKVDNLWGYINKSGQIVIEPQFNYAFSFKNGTAVVWKKIPSLPVRPVPLVIILVGLTIWVSRGIRRVR